MAAPKKVIRVPRPPSSSYNPDRPLSKNTLLKHQVEHFRKVESELPPEEKSGIDFDSIETEAHASEYVKRMTAILHSRAPKAEGD